MPQSAINAGVVDYTLPPFSKLDLIACRNVLIYFAAELQKRIVATFH